MFISRINEVGMLCLRSYDNNIFMKVLSVLFKALQKLKNLRYGTTKEMPRKTVFIHKIRNFNLLFLTQRFKLHILLKRFWTHISDLPLDGNHGILIDL